MRIVYICYVGWKVKGTAVKRQWTVKRKRQHKAVEGQGNGSEKAVDGHGKAAQGNAGAAVFVVGRRGD